MGSSELKQRFEFEICRHLLRMKKKRVFLRRVLEGKKLESNLQGHTVSEKEKRIHLAGTENSCTKWIFENKSIFQPLINNNEV